MNKNIKFTIVTGMSGAGKSQAVRSFEDLGYFCIDNLPPQLIPKIAELAVQSEGKIDKAAMVVDSRGGKFFTEIFAALDSLKNMGIYYNILFLDASDSTLIRRFKETRRRHPLGQDDRLLEAIHKERVMLSKIKEKAQKIMDTSNLTAQELKKELKNFFAGDTGQLVVTVLSFGFKHGMPVDADMVLDVRFLPNPYYISELRELTGNDAPIENYVCEKEVTKEFLSRLYSLLEFLLPQYKEEGKVSLNIAVGCTGGKHRSVVVANKIAELAENSGYSVLLKHRDITKK